MNSFPAQISLESKPLANFFILTVRARNPEKADRILNSVLKNTPRVSNYVLGKISFQILDYTGIPTEPVNKLNYVREAVIGGLIGFAAACAFSFLYIITRRTIVTEADLKTYLSIGCLSSLPAITFKKRRKKIDKFIHIYNPLISTSFCETVRAMRSRVKRAADKEGKKVILVAGSLPGEGKTIVAVNLALSLASKKEKVVIVDFDLRHPSICSVLGLTHTSDLSLESVLKVESSWKKLIYHHKEWNLDILAGTDPINSPTHLLNMPALAEMIAQLKQAYDYVILDTPPAAIISDASAIARYAEACVYVVRQDQTRIEHIAEGMEALNMVHLPILGVVLNCSKASGRSYGDYHGYYGGYGNYGASAKRSDDQNSSENQSEFIEVSAPWANSKQNENAARGD